VSQLTLLHITDTHLYADPKARLAGIDTRASFEAVLTQALAERKPELLLLTGDLAEVPDVSVYKLLQEIVNAHYQGPVIYLPGNHDDPSFAPELFSEPTFPVLSPGSSPGSKASWRVIGLNSRIPGAEGGRLSETELRRLHEQLSSAQEPNLLIAVHHPPIELGCFLDHGRIENGPQLLARLAADGRVRGLVHGHVHQSAVSEIGGLTLLATPSTCAQFLPLSEQFALDSTTPGYRWLHLSSNGDIETSTERLPQGAFPATLAPR